MVGLDALRKHLDLPFGPEEKIPISGSTWRSLLRPYYHQPKYACSDKDLDQLFIMNDDEAAHFIWPRVHTAITKSPPSVSGTEDSFHVFWDENIRDILSPCLGETETIRNSNQGTCTGTLRPDLGLFLRGCCIFRGEEKRPEHIGNHPRVELAEKTRWVYDPAPFILGARLVSPA